PWQKDGLSAPAPHRVEMLRRAFAAQPFPITLDLQEINRGGATYSVDTLRALRNELGQQTSIVLLLGADQLQQLDTWREWRQLFQLANLCAAARPGYPIEATRLPKEVAQEFSRRAGTPERIRNTPHGLTYLANELAIDAAATTIRSSLQRGTRPVSLVPPVVLDYIEQFHLYKE
ncbi:MAG: nicotinate-nicotinamide nucleotide adenylyltransferase, partial [Burkholderiaceae bacterium]|nr:nicotinate-nicotinamide nucleotide adenylyltransferase [Burkholderiaceae bacterium]